MLNRAPLACAAAFFALGIGVCWWVKPGLLLLGWLAVPLLLLLWRVRSRPAAANLLLLVLSLLLGALRACVDLREPAYSVGCWLAPQPRPLFCEGTLMSDADWVRPRHGPAQRLGWVEVTRLRGSDGWIPVCGRLRVRFPSLGPQPAFGDNLLLSGEARSPRSSVGTSGFSEARWFWLQRASGLLTVSEPEGMVILGSSAKIGIRYRRWVARWRRQLKQAGRSLVGPVESAYLEGFLLGEYQGLPLEIEDAFRRTGTVHVLVVSGQHVGLIGAVSFVTFSLLRLPRSIRYLLSAAVLVVYCTLTGANPPILRATVMGILFCVGSLGGGEFSALNGLGLAALLILCAAPRALADVGFQLSFAAVLGLFLLTPWIVRRFSAPPEGPGTVFHRWIIPGLAASLGAWIPITPVLAWHFHQLVPIALLANLLVVPWSSAMIATGFLLYASAGVDGGLAAAVAASFSWLAWGLTRLVTWMAALPGASWRW